MTTDQLVGVIARLIKQNNLREKHEDDTVGVLRRCGAFLESEDPGFLFELATAVKTRYL